MEQPQEITNIEYRKAEVIYVDPNVLTPHKLNAEIFGNLKTNETYPDLKLAIQLFGILQPLIINGTNIVSGNVRLQIAKELGFKVVPCITENEIGEYKNLQEVLSVSDELMDKYKMILHDLKKKDTVLSKIIRKEILEEMYGIKQGKRSDISPQMAAAIKERNKIASPTDRTKLNNVRKHLEEAFPGDKAKQDAWLGSLDPKASLKTVVKESSKLSISDTENPDLKKRFDFATKQINIYNQNCLDLSIIPDKSISAVVGSPPYFQRRESQGFENELGTQKNVADFIDLLVEHYVGLKSKLCADGTIWVNIADVVKNSCFTLSPERFMLEMSKHFKLLDIIYWVKSNAQPGDGDNSFQNVEYLLKFGLIEKPYTDYTWLNGISELEDITFGKGQRIKLSSFLTLKQGFIKTSGANTKRLRQLCKENGFYLEHTSTYPVEIPYMCLKISAKKDSHVLDLFNGTGTTGIASIMADMNLTYHGFEINPLSVRSSKINIEDATGEQSNCTAIPFVPNVENQSGQAA